MLVALLFVGGVATAAWMCHRLFTTANAFSNLQFATPSPYAYFECVDPDTVKPEPKRDTDYFSNPGSASFSIFSYKDNEYTRHCNEMLEVGEVSEEKDTKLLQGPVEEDHSDPEPSEEITSDEDSAEDTTTDADVSDETDSEDKEVTASPKTGMVVLEDGRIVEARIVNSRDAQDVEPDVVAPEDAHAEDETSDKEVRDTSHHLPNGMISPASILDALEDDVFLMDSRISPVEYKEQMQFTTKGVCGEIAMTIQRRELARVHGYPKSADFTLMGNRAWGWVTHKDYNPEVIMPNPDVSTESDLIVGGFMYLPTDKDLPVTQLPIGVDNAGNPCEYLTAGYRVAEMRKDAKKLFAKTDKRITLTKTICAGYLKARVGVIGEWMYFSVKYTGKEIAENILPGSMRAFAHPEDVQITGRVLLRSVAPGDEAWDFYVKDTLIQNMKTAFYRLWAYEFDKEYRIAFMPSFSDEILALASQVRSYVGRDKYAKYAKGVMRSVRRG